MSWNKKFMELAKYVSSWSKDTSTKTGAVIVDEFSNRIISVGYNGFPNGVDDTILERYDRPEKYQYTEHAERNSIYSAARLGLPLAGSKMYVMWFPCVDCARAIIQSGIKHLVCYEPDFKDERWGESFKVAHTILVEAKVKIEYYEEL